MSDQASVITKQEQVIESEDSLSIRAEAYKEIKGCCIIHLNGYIDTYNSQFFQTQVFRLIDFGYSKLIFDCTGINYVSSTGVGAFAEFLRILQPKGGNFVLVNAQPRVMDVFNLLGFTQLFAFKLTIEDGKAFFANPEQNQFKPFPKIVKCSACAKKLRVQHAGRYRCPGCKSLLAVK